MFTRFSMTEIRHFDITTLTGKKAMNSLKVKWWNKMTLSKWHPLPVHPLFHRRPLEQDFPWTYRLAWSNGLAIGINTGYGCQLVKTVNWCAKISKVQGKERWNVFTPDCSMTVKHLRHIERRQAERRSPFTRENQSRQRNRVGHGCIWTNMSLETW